MDEQRVRWLCRRGMKELDVMLGRYLERRWPEADEAEREAFAELLELQDPVLWELFTSCSIAPTEVMDDLVGRIRALSGV